MSSIGLFLKVTHACNLKCSYCYDRHFNSSERSMKLEDIFTLIDMTAKYYNSINILFHGGEPLLRSNDFYRKIGVYCLEKHPNVKFKFGMQSNATLLTKDKIKLLRSLDIGYSFSFDGISNSIFRGGTDEVLESIRLLENENYNRDIVVVANQSFLENIHAEYAFLKEIGATSVKLNNLFGPNIGQSYNELYVEKLLELFETWMYDQTAIPITQFDSLIRVALGHKEHAICSLDCHKGWIGMDYDGLVGLCDFGAFPREYNLGNLKDFTDVNEILYQPKKIAIIEEVTTRLQKCSESKCELAGICSGGCNAQIYREFGRLDEIGGSFCFITRKLVRGIKERLAFSDPTKLNHMIIGQLKQKNESKQSNSHSMCN